MKINAFLVPFPFQLAVFQQKIDEICSLLVRSSTSGSRLGTYICIMYVQCMYICRRIPDFFVFNKICIINLKFIF